MSDPIIIEPDAWCAWCGDPLPEIEERKPWMKYCSAKCCTDYGNDLRKRPKPKPRPCGWCGTVYTPKLDRGTYCTKACGWAAGNAQRGKR